MNSTPLFTEELGCLKDVAVQLTPYAKVKPFFFQA